MTGLLSLPHEVLCRIAEEVFLEDVLNGLSDLVDVQHRAETPEYAHRASWTLSILGGPNYPLSLRPRDETANVELIGELEYTVIQRFKQQRIGRAIRASFIQGVEHAACYLARATQPTFQAAFNDNILGDAPNTCSLLSLASTCRRLRASVEPIVHRVAELNHNDTRRYAKHIDLMARYPHLAQHVRALSFNTHFDGKSVPEDPVWFREKVPAILTKAGPLSTAEMLARLGPDHDTYLRDTHAWNSRFMFLLLCPNVCSLKVDLGQPHWNFWQENRVECFFTALSPDPLFARNLPALQNLREFSLILRNERHDFDVRNLLPLILLPNMRTVYTSMMHAEKAAKHNFYDMSSYNATSPITELTLDFARLRLPALASLLALPTALRKFVYSFGDAHFYTSDRSLAPTHNLEDIPIVRAIHLSACLHQFQRHSLETLIVHGGNDKEPTDRDPFPDLDAFPVLTHLKIPLRMLLVHPDGSRRSLVSALPPAIVRLELFVCDHYFVEEWVDEVLALLDARACVPGLRVVRVEQWVSADLDRSRTEQMEAVKAVTERVEARGRELGVVVKVVTYEGVVKTRLSAS